MAIVIGSIYFRIVEEKELVQRFGEEYRRNHEKPPFLCHEFVSENRYYLISTGFYTR